MRLASLAKLGYYPTPDSIVQDLAARLTTTGKITAIDPCTGTGKALADITAGLPGALTYGIEPDRLRYLEADGLLSQALHATLEDCSIAHNSFSLLYLNPPYDFHYDNDAASLTPDQFRDKHKTKRKEIHFLQRTLPYLAPAGLLIYIVPEHILDKHCNEYLSSRLDNPTAYRFPQDIYPEFKQIVVVGNKKTTKPQPSPALITITEYQDRTTGPLTLPITSPCKLFRANKLSAELATDLYEQQRDALLHTLYPVYTNPMDNATAPLPLHLGHLSLMLAAGKINGLMKPGTPERHIVRGTVSKYRTVSQQTEETDSGHCNITRTRDSYAVSVKILHPNGLIEQLE